MKLSVTGSGKGFSDVLSKVRMNKRTKEAVQMNEAYEPTQTAVQYWDQVKEDLKKRGASYERTFGGSSGQGADRARPWRTAVVSRSTSRRSPWWCIPSRTGRRSMWP